MVQVATGPSSPAQLTLKVTHDQPHEFDIWQAAVAPMFDIGPLSEDACCLHDGDSGLLPARSRDHDDQSVRLHIACLSAHHPPLAFSRAFRGLYKMTPNDVRSAARAGHFSSHADTAQADASFGTLNRWLLGLDANSGADD